jgi:serine/threonine protein kinase
MLHPGQILDGKYEILKVLGQGGMGIVYLCKNNRLGNLWAVKEVNKQMKNKIDFLAEPNILKNLSHIGIIRIIDIFYEDDNLYIVEDYIEGETLKEHVDTNGPLSQELMLDISLQLCSILDYLHFFNPPIVYRDLKPSNIMIKPNNKVVLIDFGIARTYKEGQQGDTMILGSQGYIAPEQLVNVQSNAQTDIYSLGATMFFMLTGKSINLPTELMFDENYPDHVDKSLVRVIQNASAIEPENRYNDVKLMLPELNAIIADGEYKKTIFVDSRKPDGEAVKTVLVKDKKPGKITKFIIIAVLACIIALVVFLAMLMSEKSSDKKASETPAVPKTAEPKVEAKPEIQPPKEVVEKDSIIRGVLDSKKPVVLSSGSSNGKTKGKAKEDDKQLHVQFILNPAAAILSSKLSISLTSIEVINNDVIAVLSIQNTAEAALKLDLSKTYLVNGKNDSTKSYNPNSTSLLSIPQSSKKQELKLYFKDFDFEGSPYTLKTVLSSAVNKDINLNVDIK